MPFVLLTLAACASSGGGRSVAAAPVELPALEGERARTAELVGDAPLVDQTGRERRVFTELVRDRVVVISFVYTRCQGSCPGTTAKLARVRDLLGERFGRDVTFVTFTLDPERATPADFAEYARAHGVTHGWTFLTGGKERLDKLRRDLGFYDLDPVLDADRTQHAAMLAIGNEPRGRWMHLPAALPADAIVRAIERVAR
ncbi:MAG: SCO family protein [Planctomycetes bacterium]|nr:SCO family protein [Planctomycetota bacterium]